MFDDDREDRMTRRERVLRRAKDRWRDRSSDRADEEDYSIDRMYRSADQLASLPTPHLDVDEWEYERNAREQRRERREHRSYPPEPKPPLIPEAALRVLVGDLAPQAAGALNYLQNNKTAQSAAAMAGMGLVALVLPQVLK